MKIFREHFGKKLQSAMRDANLSQTALSKLLEVNPSAVSRWVRAEDFPDDSRLPDISAALRVPEEYWIGPPRETLLGLAVIRLAALNDSELNDVLTAIDSIVAARGEGAAQGASKA